jgi:hypothetical protein
MKTKAFYLLVLYLGFSFLSGCSKPDTPSVKIIKITGMEMVFNFSKSAGEFGSADAENDTSAIAAEEGDALFLLHESLDESLILRYNSEMGSELHFDFDTLSPWKMMMNGHLVSLALGDETGAWPWLENAETSDFDDMQVLFLSGELDESKIGLLDKMGDKSIGLHIEGNLPAAQLEQLLEILNVAWFWGADLDDFIFTDGLVSGLKEIDMMVLSPVVTGNINRLTELQRLQEIIVSGYHPAESLSLDFSKIVSLKRISFIESDIQSLAELDLPVAIENLFFINCDTLSDISTIGDLNKLKTAGFVNCPILEDLTPLFGNHDLIWFAPPPGITQDQLVLSVESFPELEVLELIDCDGITDLSVLSPLGSLRALSLDLPDIEASQVANIQSLELLVVSDEIDNIEVFRELLPNTIVVPGGGFCLGSGWILLILPVVILGIWLRSLMNKKRA